MPLTVLCTAAEVSTVGPAWEDLVANAAEPNPFLERFMLVPGIESYPDPEALVLFAYSDRTGELIGLFALRKARGYRRIPVSYVTSWAHPQCFLSTPVLRKGHEDEALDLLFAWLDAAAENGCMLELRQIRADGPVYESIRRAAERRQRPLDVLFYERALLHSDLAPEEYLKRAIPGKKLKEYRRLTRRLAEHGKVETESLPADGDVESWVSQFLELESRGWKGAAGTALATHEHEAAFFRGVVRGAFARGQLLMHRMTLDGVPIAMKCSFSSGRAGFAVKIAYDETWAKFSPGFLLELWNVGSVLESDALDWMDSCAVPDHFMINRLWTERRRLGELIVSREPMSSRLVTATIAGLRRMQRSFKRSNPVERPESDLHD
jgi:CelD/BcsL family acetyltransferase involved in cellulose biosynthesis